MALHTVNLLPGDPACHSAIAELVPEDTVLFHGDGAWHARAGIAALDAWAATGAALYALSADLEACGLAAHADPRVTVVDAAGFVRLSEQQAQQRAWY